MELGPLVAGDEFVHEPIGSSSAPWRDTWWFVCRDSERDVAIEAHITISADQSPAGRSAVLLSTGVKNCTDVYQGDQLLTTDRVGTKNIQIQVLNGEWDERKHLVLHGELVEDDASFEVELRGRYRAADAVALAPGFMPTDPSAGSVLRNVQHMMTFRGTLRWNGSSQDLCGNAFRDRSWGWRKTNELMRFGWHSFFGHTEDATLSIVGFFGSDARVGEGTRVAAWIADDTGISPATEAQIELDVTGRPARVVVDGRRRIDLRAIRQERTTHLPFHDAPAGQNVLMIAMTNHYVAMVDELGHPAWGVTNTGTPFNTHIMSGASVFAAPSSSVESDS